MILFLVISLLLFKFSNGQDSEVDVKRIIYKKLGNSELYVDMFFTQSSLQKKDNTAIAFFHGGGWVFGDPSEFNEACKRFARNGYIAFTFQYRLSINADGSYPNPAITPVESTKDARSAIRWLRENAIELNVNPDKIVVGGQSAGGQLALSTALIDSVNEITDNLKISTVPNALLLFSSNVNTIEVWIDMLLGERRTEIWSISPYHNLKNQMPPVIAFRGDMDDQVLPYIAGMFKARMIQLGNYYEEYVYTEIGRAHV